MRKWNGNINLSMAFWAAVILLILFKPELLIPFVITSFICGMIAYIGFYLLWNYAWKKGAVKFKEKD